MGLERVAHLAGEIEPHVMRFEERCHVGLVRLLRGFVVEVLFVKIPCLFVSGVGEVGEELEWLEVKRECHGGCGFPNFGESFF